MGFRYHHTFGWKIFHWCHVTIEALTSLRQYECFTWSHGQSDCWGTEVTCSMRMHIDAIRDTNTGQHGACCHGYHVTSVECCGYWMCHFASLLILSSIPHKKNKNRSTWAALDGLCKGIWRKWRTTR